MIIVEGINNYVLEAAKDYKKLDDGYIFAYGVEWTLIQVKGNAHYEQFEWAYNPTKRVYDKIGNGYTEVQIAPVFYPVYHERSKTYIFESECGEKFEIEVPILDWYIGGKFIKTIEYDDPTK